MLHLYILSQLCRAANCGYTNTIVNLSITKWRACTTHLGIYKLVLQPSFSLPSLVCIFGIHTWGMLDCEACWSSGQNTSFVTKRCQIRILAMPVATFSTRNFLRQRIHYVKLLTPLLMPTQHSTSIGRKINTIFRLRVSRMHVWASE